MNKNEYATMTSIAAQFAEQTSHSVGKALKRLDLRLPNGDPSDQAKALGLVYMTEGPEPWIPLWLWHEEKTIGILEADGMVRKDGQQNG
jgi:hypothetical protein